MASTNDSSSPAASIADSPAPLPRGQKIVLKVGTSSLVRSEQQTLNISNLARIADTVKLLHDQGHHVILVSSGAVGVGCQRLGLTSRPTQLARKQALAAVGQVHLMRYYEDFLSSLGLCCAQVLLTRNNLTKREQRMSVRNTFDELLSYGTIPIVNENDTVAVQELRFGDNDTLSAQVATLVQADWLFLLTDVDCLYTSNPKLNPDAQPIYEVEDMSRLQADTSTQGTEWGTGGMATKLMAGRIATAAGCTMVICNSNNPEAVAQVLAGERVGTKFHPCRTPAPSVVPTLMGPEMSKSESSRAVAAAAASAAAKLLPATLTWSQSKALRVQAKLLLLSVLQNAKHLEGSKSPAAAASRQMSSSEPGLPAVMRASRSFTGSSVGGTPVSQRMQVAEQSMAS